MKKLIVVVLAAVLLIFVVGCSKGQIDNKKTIEIEQEQEESSDIGTDIEGLTEDTSELDTSDMDGIENDLEDFNW